MNPYLALIKNDLRLALRDRQVIFFNFIFPLVFLFAFGGMFGADRNPGGATLVVTSVLVIGILGNGLFGAGMRAVMDREAGILRRFKVAPITPVPVLVASLVTGWLLYIPNIVTIVGLAHVSSHALVQTVIQTYSPAAFRGRTMAIFHMSSVVWVLGGMLAGTLAALVGARWAAASMGAVGALIAVTIGVALPGARRIR